jgi:hypothetical protein
MPQKHPLSLRLRPELHEQVKAFVAEQGASTNEAINVNVLIERGLGTEVIKRLLEAEVAQLRQERDQAQARVNLLTDRLLDLK